MVWFCPTYCQPSSAVRTYSTLLAYLETDTCITSLLAHPKTETCITTLSSQPKLPRLLHPPHTSRNRNLDHHPLPPPYSTLLAHLGTETCIATLLAYHETKTYITIRGSLAKLAMSCLRLPDHVKATRVTDYCTKCNITFKEPFQP